MNWIQLRTFRLDEDLLYLHKYLQEKRILHRFTEARGRQVLWVTDDRHCELIDAVITQAVTPASREGGGGGFVVNDITDVEVDRTRESETSTNIVQLLFSSSILRSLLHLSPFTFGVIVLGVIGYLLFKFVPNSPLSQGLLFNPPSVLLREWDFWRLLTPAFIHFSFPHILFNGLWVWELGGRIEKTLCIKHYLALFMVIAIGANCIEYMFSSTPYFGGLSGIVYGYLGFLLIAKRRSDNPMYNVPNGVFIFMLAWLFLGFFGIVDFFISGKVANGAHLGGLIMGVVCGWVYFAKIEATNEHR